MRFVCRDLEASLNGNAVVTRFRAELGGLRLIGGRSVGQVEVYDDIDDTPRSSSNKEMDIISLLCVRLVNASISRELMKGQSVVSV